MTQRFSNVLASRGGGGLGRGAFNYPLPEGGGIKVKLLNERH